MKQLSQIRREQDRAELNNRITDLDSEGSDTYQIAKRVRMTEAYVYNYLMSRGWV